MPSSDNVFAGRTKTGDVFTKYIFHEFLFRPGHDMSDITHESNFAIDMRVSMSEIEHEFDTFFIASIQR